jgi:hypothetical protein
MQRRTMLALMAAAAVAPTSALAQQKRSASAVFPLLGPYFRLPVLQRNLFHLAYRAVRRGRLAFDTHAQIVDGQGQRTPITLDRLGFVAETPSPGEINSDAQVEFQGDPMRFQIEVRATLPPIDRVDPATLARAIDELNSAINKVLGGLNFFVPTMTAAFFPESGGGRVVFADGRSALLPVFPTPLDGPTPYFEPARFPRAAAVVLDRAPTRITLGVPLRT